MLMENFIATANNKGEKPAIVAGGESWTYRRLLKMVHKAAAYFKKTAAGLPAPVGLCFPNTVEFVILLLASGLAGRPAVLLGASFKAREIHYHVQNAGIKTVLAGKQLAATMQAAGGIKGEAPWEAVDCWSFESNEGHRFREGDFICQLTSGTNGTPKAAVRTHEAVWIEVRDTIKDTAMTCDDKLMTLPPIHHSYGLIGGTLGPLIAGATLVLPPVFLPADALEVLRRDRITVLFAVPFMYHLFNEAIARAREQRFPAGRERLFPALRIPLSAGAPLPPEISRTFHHLTGKQICQDYGSTETGVICLNLQTGQFPKSVGLPVGEHEVKAFGENGDPLPSGVEGELRVSSKATARAYLYPAELNQTAFHNGWFITGDLGRVDDNGYVYVTGRKSGIINVAGSKVDPVEVEEVIARLPGVKEVAVVGVDGGSSGQIVKAFIVTGADLKEPEIIYYCRENLADYKVPRVIQFIDELPRSQTGKVLRKYLTIS